MLFQVMEKRRILRRSALDHLARLSEFQNSDGRTSTSDCCPTCLGPSKPIYTRGESEILPSIPLTDLVDIADVPLA